MPRRPLLALFLAAAWGCDDGASAPPADAGQPPIPDGAVVDAPDPGPDPDGSAAPPVDASVPPPPIDAAPPPPPPVDAGWTGEDHVHITIDNFCNVSTDPESFTVPAGETLQLTWHNHSVDYNADVWLSYGGGYLGLVTGGTWADGFMFCSGPSSYDASGDVNIEGGPFPSCPGFRVLIHCL